MNFKNLAMWAVIVFLTIGLYNMFKNPQSRVSGGDKIIFSDFLTSVDNGEVLKVEIQGNNIDIGGYNTYSLNLNSPTTNISGNATVGGSALFASDVSGTNTPTMPEHLTRKDYVDAADGALLDSLNALDSMMVANSLWS